MRTKRRWGEREKRVDWGGKKGKKKRTEVNYDDGNFIINNNNIN